MPAREHHSVMSKSKKASESYQVDSVPDHDSAELVRDKRSATTRYPINIDIPTLFLAKTNNM